MMVERVGAREPALAEGQAPEVSLHELDVAGGAILGLAIAFWVLGGRHPATYSSTLPKPLPSGVLIRP